jgi:hypothetical protein
VSTASEATAAPTEISAPVDLTALIVRQFGNERGEEAAVVVDTAANSDTVVVDTDFANIITAATAVPISSPDAANIITAVDLTAKAPTKPISAAASAAAFQILQLSGDVIDSPAGKLSSSSNHAVPESLKRSKKRGIKK